MPFTDPRIDSIENPHLNDETGANIALPDETFGSSGRHKHRRLQERHFRRPAQ